MLKNYIHIFIPNSFRWLPVKAAAFARQNGPEARARKRFPTFAKITIAAKAERAVELHVSCF